MFGLIPPPATALDQMPAVPSPLHWLRLAESLYYHSRAWLDSDHAFPPSFHQLNGWSARYYSLARYLVQRRRRPGAPPPDPDHVRSRALAWLHDTAHNYPGALAEVGQGITLNGVQAYLLEYYPISPAEAAAWAQCWLANPPPATW